MSAAADTSSGKLPEPVARPPRSSRLKDWWLRLTDRGDLPLAGDDSGRFLPWVVAVMVFLATLSVAAALAVGAAAERWQSDLAGSATVQIAAGVPDAKPGPPGTRITPESLDPRVDAAVRLLRGTPGIRRADPHTQEAAAALIAPWLGSAASLADLPMPRLIDVSFDASQVDVAALGRALAAAAPGASFDDHRRWIDGLTAIARWVILVASGIVLLVGAVATLSVIFAVRSGLAVHREVIEILHLIGAHDHYIANNFARHTLWTGLKGGAIGSAVALATLAALGWAGRDMAPGLMPGLTLHGSDWAILVLLTPLAATLAAATARSTVLSALNRLI
jgi:cell division transport system permease protein